MQIFEVVGWIIVSNALFFSIGVWLGGCIVTKRERNYRQGQFEAELRTPPTIPIVLIATDGREIVRMKVKNMIKSVALPGRDTKLPISGLITDSRQAFTKTTYEIDPDSAIVYKEIVNEIQS